MGLNYDILDTTAVVRTMEPAIRDRDTSGGHSIWCERDGVHLSREAYINIAGAIIEATVGFGGSDVDEAAGGSYESSKRRQQNSVVTLPAPPPPQKRGHGPGEPNEAGWLRGEADKASTAPLRGAYCARGHGRVRGRGSHLWRS
jgi:hypothetical protein